MTRSSVLAPGTRRGIYGRLSRLRQNFVFLFSRPQTPLRPLNQPQTLLTRAYDYQTPGETAAGDVCSMAAFSVRLSSSRISRFASPAFVLGDVRNSFSRVPSEISSITSQTRSPIITPETANMRWLDLWQLFSNPEIFHRDVNQMTYQNQNILRFTEKESLLSP